MQTKRISQKQAKRLLPALLKRYRKRNLTVAVVRKRDAHDPRLPENRIAKARAIQKAAQESAAGQAIAQRQVADLKAAIAAARINLSAAIADAPAVEEAA